MKEKGSDGKEDHEKEHEKRETQNTKKRSPRRTSRSSTDWQTIDETLRTARKTQFIDKRQGLVWRRLKCLVFQRSGGTSNVSEADVFDFSGSHRAAFWLCFFGIAIFDSTSCTPPRLTPRPANVFSHSICSTVTAGIMSLPFPSLCDVWHARSTNETPGPGNAMFTPNKSNNVTALWRYFNSPGACFLPSDKTT